MVLLPRKIKFDNTGLGPWWTVDRFGPFGQLGRPSTAVVKTLRHDDFVQSIGCDENRRSGAQGSRCRTVRRVERFRKVSSRPAVSRSAAVNAAVL